MRFVYAFIVIAFFQVGCTKNTTKSSMLAGIWVEQSLRLDTLDFDKTPNFTTNSDSIGTVQFRCKPFTDITINPSFPVNNSTFYNYYVKDDSLFLRNFLSSYSGFYGFKYTMSNSEESFSVARFYNRNTLPATITFTRIR